MERINPDGMARSPYYSQATLVPAGAALLFVGGQNAVDASGTLIEGDAAAQTERVMTNVVACLDAAGATTADLVSLEVKVVAGTDLGAAQQVAARFLPVESPPLVSVSIVTQLARPGALVEVSAVAAVVEAADEAWLGREAPHDPAWF